MSAGGSSSAPPAPSKGKGEGKGKGKGKDDEISRESEAQKPRAISAELRGLLSRKVDVLPRKVIRKEGEGVATVKR